MIGPAAEDRSARLWIIHFSFIAAVPLFLFLVPLLSTQAQDLPRPSGMDQRSLLIYGVFAALSLVDVVIAFNIGNWIKLVAADPSDTATVYLNKRIVETVLMDAFFESIAIYGLAGLFAGLHPWQAISLMFVALIFQVIVIGRLKGWVDEYRRRLHLDRHPV